VEVDEYDESNEALMKAYNTTSGARSFDVELGPLMNQGQDNNTGNVFRAKSRLIVVKGPDDAMTMGISTYTPLL